jgi:glycosyltransferase involved in cell wall biosynthesis
MKILSISPYLKSPVFHPEPEGVADQSHRAVQAMANRGQEVFVLPWKTEKIWETRKYLTSEDYSFATALPTLYIPSLTHLIKNLLKSSLSKKILGNPVEHIRKTISGQFNGEQHFLNNAMSYAMPDIVHTHLAVGEMITAYREGEYSAPVVLSTHGRSFSSAYKLYDYVIFPSNLHRRLAIKMAPELELVSKVIHPCPADPFFMKTEFREDKKICITGGKVWDKIISELTGRLASKREQPDISVTFLSKSLHTRAQQMRESALYIAEAEETYWPLRYAEALCMGLPIIGPPNQISEINSLLGITCGLEVGYENLSAEVLFNTIQKAEDIGLLLPEYRKKIMDRARVCFSRKSFDDNHIRLYKEMVS